MLSSIEQRRIPMIIPLGVLLPLLRDRATRHVRGHTIIFHQREERIIKHNNYRGNANPFDGKTKRFFAFKTRIFEYKETINTNMIGRRNSKTLSNYYAYL